MAVSGTPDLQLVISSLESTLSIGVSGKLDFIDALAMAVSPVAPAIREARARMAAGEYVTGTLDAYLEMAATGSLRHSIDSGVRVVIPANGSMDTTYASIQQQFGGEFKINGQAEIAIEVEAQVWVFSARAGASGSLHTAWIWTMRMQEGERQKRYEFEGVIVTLTAYAEVRIDNDDDDIVRQTGPELGGSLERDAQASDFFTQVRDDIASSQAAAETMANQRPETPPQGRNFSIWSPEVTEWQAY